MAPAGIGHKVEGVHAVAAALPRGRSLTVERRRLRHAEIDDLVKAARDRGIAVVVTDSVQDLAQTDNPQGIVLDAEPIPTVSLDELAERPDAALLLLDHVEDPHNLGAAARSAHAAGMTGLVVPERRAAPLGPSAFKAAAGAFEHLPVAVVSSVADAVTRLKDRSVWTVGLAADAPERLFGLGLFSEPVAIVVGSEGTGLGRLVRERLDLLVSIPLVPGAESLNASVAAALASFEVARVRGGRWCGSG